MKQSVCQHFTHKKYVTKASSSIVVFYLRELEGGDQRWRRSLSSQLHHRFRQNLRRWRTILCLLVAWCWDKWNYHFHHRVNQRRHRGPESDGTKAIRGERMTIYHCGGAPLTIIWAVYLCRRWKLKRGVLYSTVKERMEEYRSWYYSFMKEYLILRQKKWSRRVYRSRRFVNSEILEVQLWMIEFSRSLMHSMKFSWEELNSNEL